MSALCRDCFWNGSDPAGRRCPLCASPRLAEHAELFSLCIAHIDCDAFYATVEKRDRPEFRDRPVIVGGGERGVVTTCCYIARTYGVRSAMPMFKALRACPDAVVIRPDFTKYRRESRRILDHLRALTPLVQPLSLDEAWLDLAGTERLNNGPPALVLAKAQAAIEAETGLTVSVGLGPNKLLAKIASDLDKPKGFFVIGSAEAAAFLSPRPISILPGVGPSLAGALERAGLRRVEDLSRADLRWLVDRFGSQGLRLARLAAGDDPRPVEPLEAAKSISAESTFREDLADLARLEDQLWPLCEKVAWRARRTAVTGRVATLKLKTADFRSLTRRRTLPAPIQTARTLFASVRPFLGQETKTNRHFRLIGVGLSDLRASTEEEAVLFVEEERRSRRTESAIDRLRERFGEAAVVSGRALRSLGPSGPVGEPE